MNSQSTPAELPAPSYFGAEKHVCILNDQLDVSVRMSRILLAQVEAAPAEQSVTAAGIAMHGEACRTLRRNIFLARLCTLPAGTLRVDDGGRRRKMARARILRGVEDAIHAKVDDIDDAESLRGELYDRMDASDLDDDIETWPPDEIITEVCRDLGLGDRAPGAFAWKRRTPEDIASLNAKAAETAPPVVAARFALDRPVRVLDPKIRPVRDAWWDLPDPDKPLSQWTDAELDRAEAREQQDSG